MRRQRDEPQRRARHDSERALASDEQRQQVVAGDVLAILAPELEHARPPGTTTRRPDTYRPVVPYFAARGPPAFSAMLPPIVQEPREDGSGG